MSIFRSVAIPEIECRRGANFRTDVTVNGAINSSDIGTVKAKSGTSLP